MMGQHPGLTALYSYCDSLARVSAMIGLESPAATQKESDYRGFSIIDCFVILHFWEQTSVSSELRKNLDMENAEPGGY